MSGNYCGLTLRRMKVSHLINNRRLRSFGFLPPNQFLNLLNAMVSASRIEEARLTLSRDGNVYVGLYPNLLSVIGNRVSAAMLSFASQLDSNEGNRAGRQ